MIPANYTHDNFTYREGQLFCEDITVSKIVQEHGSPLYIYSAASLTKQYNTLKQNFQELAPRICYAIKANSNLSILSYLEKLGACFEVGSGGELYRALAAGISPEKISLGGIGKTQRDIYEALCKKVFSINVESLEELQYIEKIARQNNFRPQITLRINPDIPANTHEYITTATARSKFGMSLNEVDHIITNNQPRHFTISGLHIHLGSQITDIDVYLQAIRQILPLMEQAQKNHPIEWLNLGGGFGIAYKPEEPNILEELARRVTAELKRIPYSIIIEPGRFLVGPMGILVTQVLYNKTHGDYHFLVADAGMHTLIRPLLYDAYHHIWPIKEQQRPMHTYDIVGPLCESSDYLAKQRCIPEVLKDEYLAIFTTGAYGMSMTSNYNSYPRPAEVFVERDSCKLIRKRESYTDLVRLEKFE